MNNILVINSSVSGDASVSRTLVEDAVRQLLEVHLKMLLGFIGITEVTFIHAEKIGFGPEARELAITEAKDRIAETISARSLLRYTA